MEGSWKKKIQFTQVGSKDRSSIPCPSKECADNLQWKKEKGRRKTAVLVNPGRRLGKIVNWVWTSCLKLNCRLHNPRTYGAGGTGVFVASVIVPSLRKIIIIPFSEIMFSLRLNKNRGVGANKKKIYLTIICRAKQALALLILEVRCSGFRVAQAFGMCRFA